MSRLFAQLRAAGRAAVPQLLGVTAHDAAWVGDGRYGPLAVASSPGEVYAYLKASDHVREAAAAWVDGGRPFPPALVLWTHAESAESTPLRCFVWEGSLVGISEVEPPYAPSQLWDGAGRRASTAARLERVWRRVVHPALTRLGREGGRLTSYCLDVRFIPSDSAEEAGSEGDDGEEGGAVACGGVKVEVLRVLPLVVVAAGASTGKGSGRGESDGREGWTGDVAVSVDTCLFAVEEVTGRGRASLPAGCTAHASTSGVASPSRVEARVDAGRARGLPELRTFTSHGHGSEEEIGARPGAPPIVTPHRRGGAIHFHPLAQHALPDDVIDMAGQALERMLEEARAATRTLPPPRPAGARGAEAAAPSASPPGGGWQSMVGALHAQGLFVAGGRSESEASSESEGDSDT